MGRAQLPQPFQRFTRCPKNPLPTRPKNLQPDAITRDRMVDRAERFERLSFEPQCLPCRSIQSPVIDLKLNIRKLPQMRVENTRGPLTDQQAAALFCDECR